MCGDRVQRAVGVESTMKRRRERNLKERIRDRREVARRKEKE